MCPSPSDVFLFLSLSLPLSFKKDNWKKYPQVIVNKTKQKKMNNEWLFRVQARMTNLNSQTNKSPCNRDTGHFLFRELQKTYKEENCELNLEGYLRIFQIVN